MLLSLLFLNLLLNFSFLRVIRFAICQQVLKGIIDRVEREEKNNQRKQKLKESAEERKIKASNQRLQGYLHKHLEVLRKDILKKRAIMEKEIQAEIQVMKFSNYFQSIIRNK